MPLATHTGWNLRHPDIGGAEQLLVFAGATLPFARTRAEREATGDPRPSIEERYASRERVSRPRARRPRRRWRARATCWRTTSTLSVAAGARFWDHFTR